MTAVPSNLPDVSDQVASQADVEGDLHTISPCWVPHTHLHPSKGALDHAPVTRLKSEAFASPLGDGGAVVDVGAGDSVVRVIGQPSRLAGRCLPRAVPHVFPDAAMTLIHCCLLLGCSSASHTNDPHQAWVQTGRGHHPLPTRNTCRLASDFQMN